jgi:hypothetical protein
MNLLYSFLSITSWSDFPPRYEHLSLFLFEIFNKVVSLLTLFGSMNTRITQKGVCQQGYMPNFNSEYIDIIH